ncbi:hypothetical protein F511_25526 [Dorcoceras hygrometricum]|uniref:Uncharacterized protein n=1 Tax=Dorcoceras hygrometricum TaxID=472368 RepID=A0A2Z7AEQ4_9LAMI|nr:hypothetical protein F511_25526 [Dorcoceras hygrometricum]
MAFEGFVANLFGIAHTLPFRGTLCAKAKLMEVSSCVCCAGSYLFSHWMAWYTMVYTYRVNYEGSGYIFENWKQSCFIGVAEETVRRFGDAEKIVCKIQIVTYSISICNLYFVK